MRRLIRRMNRIILQDGAKILPEGGCSFFVGRRFGKMADFDCLLFVFLLSDGEELLILIGSSFIR